MLAGAVIAPQPIPRGMPSGRPPGTRTTAPLGRQRGRPFEWSERERTTFEEGLRTSYGGPATRTGSCVSSIDPEGAVVGMAFVIVSSGCAYVDKLAVRKDQRGRGWRALLVDAFETGAPRRRTLRAVDRPRTGALGLYGRSACRSRRCGATSRSTSA